MKVFAVEFKEYVSYGFHGASYSSVDQSATTILLPLVQIESTTYTLFSIIWKLKLYLLFECEKTENKQKEAGSGPYLKKVMANLAKLVPIVSSTPTTIPSHLKCSVLYI